MIIAPNSFVLRHSPHVEKGYSHDFVSGQDLGCLSAHFYPVHESSMRRDKDKRGDSGNEEAKGGRTSKVIGNFGQFGQDSA